MVSASDRAFIAAAKKLGLLSDEQVKDCLALADERRALGLAKELADVALEKGFLAPDGWKRIQALLKASAAATAPPARAAEPDLVEGYQILGKLGQGATATVYRARHRVLEKELALKVLSPELSRDAEYVTRFLREARAAAKLDHPNLVAIHDAGEARGRHYMAMELVDGLSLEKLVARDGPLSEIGTLEVGRDVARALGAAHEAKLVHRDVKPENIVRTPDGRVKLLDLGIARDIGAARPGGGALTEDGMTLGTPFFVSPEQARGEAVDGRSDLYSLGVTLFFLATGERPFTGAAPAEVMRRHIEDAVPSARVLRPALSPGLDALLQKLMAKDPRRRYQSASELAAAIELLLADGGGGRGAAPAAAPAPREKPARPHPRPLAAKPAPPPPPEPPARTPAQALLYAIGGLAVLLTILVIVKSAMPGIEVPEREVADARRRAEAQEARASAAEKPHRERAPGAVEGGAAPEAATPPGLAAALSKAHDFERRGEFAKARTALERFIQTNKGSKEADDALREIQRLRGAEQEARRRAPAVPDGPVVAKVEPDAAPEAPLPPPPPNPFADPFATPAAGAPARPQPPAPPPSPSGPLNPPRAPPASEPAAPAPATPPAPEPPPAPPAGLPLSKFQRVFAALLKAPVSPKHDDAVWVHYKLTKANEAHFKDWIAVKPPFSSSCGAEGLEVQAAGKQPGRFRHVVPFVTPIDVLLLFRIEPGRSGSPRVSLIFGEQEGGSDYALGADLSLAKRKNGEAVRVLHHAAKGLETLPAGVDLALRLEVADGDVRFNFEQVGEAKKTAGNQKLAEEDAAGFVGFEVQDAKVLLQDFSIRAAPEPNWLAQEIKALGD
jgi:serine/threonine protein kinase